MLIPREEMSVIVALEIYFRDYQAQATHGQLAEQSTHTNQSGEMLVIHLQGLQ